MSAVDAWRAYGRDGPFRHAYIGGTFDCLHRGHLALFANARKLAERVTVSINRDEFCARYKRRPLMPLADRFAVLEQCRLVDRVIINHGDEDSRPAIIEASRTITAAQLKAQGVTPGASLTIVPDYIIPIDVIVHGDDWMGDGYLRQLGLTEAWLDEHCIRLAYLPYTRHVSTSELLAAYSLRQQRESA